MECQLDIESPQVLVHENKKVGEQELVELIKKEMLLFDSVEEYLAWLNNWFRKTYKPLPTRTYIFNNGVKVL